MASEMLFDQYSRYKACADLIHQMDFVSGSSVLDIGSGPECLFGRFMEDATMTYVDPLIGSEGDKERIKGNIFSHELDGRNFDYVSAVDVLEHVPPQFRHEFLKRASQLCKKVLILGFPSSDDSSASDTDKFIDEKYRSFYGHDYSWLEEHYRFGLPSLSSTIADLEKLGWHCQAVGHGHAPWLKELLGFVICAWDNPSLKGVASTISERFNQQLYHADFRPPFYRHFVIASRNPHRQVSVPSVQGSNEDVDAMFRSLMEQAYEMQFAASVKQIAQKDKEIVSLHEQLGELSSSLENERAELINERAELMRMSHWADGMRRELERRDNKVLARTIQSAARIKATARNTLAKSFVGDLVRYARDRKNYAMTKSNLAAIRESVAANNGKLIVAFPIITWSFRWQRPQHILTRLRNNGYTILYVAMSVATAGRKFGSPREAGSLLKFSLLEPQIHKIWLHSAGKLNVYSDPIADDDLHNLVCGLSAAIEEIKPTSIDYLIQFPGWWPVAQSLRELHGGKVIFDCMDDHSGFSTNSVQALQTEEDLIEQSDLVITSSKALEDKVRLLTPKTIQVKNGTEFEHFKSPVPNGELDHLIGKPIIGYYGAISDWFDVELLEYCAKSHPEWNFVLIGATFGANLKGVEGLNNIYFLGEKKYAELPGYLAYFDVCMIPFKIVPLTIATNPVKFYEYISAGKPVVSVALPELLPYSEDCYLARDVKEFDALLVRALEERNNLEKISRRIQLAKENSWDSRVNSVIAAMKSLSNGC